MGSSFLAVGSTEAKTVSRAVGNRDVSATAAHKILPIAGCVSAAVAHDGKMHVMSVSFPSTPGLPAQYIAFTTPSARDAFMRALQAKSAALAAESLTAAAASGAAAAFPRAVAAAAIISGANIEKPHAAAASGVSGAAAVPSAPPIDDDRNDTLSFVHSLSDIPTEPMQHQHPYNISAMQYQQYHQQQQQQHQQQQQRQFQQHHNQSYNQQQLVAQYGQQQYAAVTSLEGFL